MVIFENISTFKEINDNRNIINNYCYTFVGLNFY